MSQMKRWAQQTALELSTVVHSDMCNTEDEDISEDKKVNIDEIKVC